MVQFYALSVVVNVLSGLLLAGAAKEKKTTFLYKLKSLFETKAAKFSLGLLSLIVGLFKILTPTAGDVPVVGDILPAVTGFVLGGILLLDFMRTSSDLQEEPNKLTTRILSNKKYIGMAGIVVGVLHFLMPGVIIV